MKTFPLTVVTPDGCMFDGEAVSLLTRAANGDVEILAGHMDMMAPIGIGRTVIRTETESRTAAVSGGFLTVSEGKVTLVAVTFEYAQSIDAVRAAAAKNRAEEKLKNSHDRQEAEKARAKLLRALTRLDVASHL